MDCVFLWMDDNDDDGLPERVQRKLIRDNSNILSLNEKKLSKYAFLYVFNSIKDNLSAPQRSKAIPSLLKLAATLKFLGQGGYQHQIGQDRLLGISQQSISSCIVEVCQATEDILCPKHIIFEMTDENKRDAKLYFYKCGIPGVIGAVDGTHIQIIKPSTDEHLYLGRKLKHSINAMIICDHQSGLWQVRHVDVKSLLL